MSFVKQQLHMPNSTTHLRNAQRLKLCTQCEEKKPPEGGIQMNQTRWICAACWVAKATRRKP
jgi:hypothetical protein